MGAQIGDNIYIDWEGNNRKETNSQTGKLGNRHPTTRTRRTSTTSNLELA